LISASTCETASDWLGGAGDEEVGPGDGAGGDDGGGDDDGGDEGAGADGLGEEGDGDGEPGCRRLLRWLAVSRAAFRPVRFPAEPSVPVPRPVCTVCWLAAGCGHSAVACCCPGVHAADAAAGSAVCTGVVAPRLM
jgi:hypothetical protein